MNYEKGLITVISGFSGAGKGTIVKHLLMDYPDVYHLSISATTRSPRVGEEDGREYFFKTRQEFEELIANNGLIEHAQFNGNYYGTPRAYVEGLVDQGKDVILEIDVKGALQIRKIYPNALLLFVTPPSAEVLKDRLVIRNTETMEVIMQRMAISVKESYLMDQYDYLIVNDVLEDSVKRVHSIISNTHCRIDCSQKFIDSMQQELAVFAKGV